MFLHFFLFLFIITTTPQTPGAVENAYNGAQ